MEKVAACSRQLIPYPILTATLLTTDLGKVQSAKRLTGQRQQYQCRLFISRA
jgi:hypothetical protein